MLNRVPEKVPEKVPGSLGAKPSQVQQGSGEVLEKVGEALVQSQVRFNRVPEKVPEKVAQSQVRLIRVPQNIPEKVWEALVQSQLRVNRVLEKVPEKVPGGFGAEPGQVQQVSGEGSGKVWCRARSGSTGFRRIFRRRFQEALNECNAKSGSTGSGECYRSQARWGSFSSRKASWGVSSQHASERFIKIKRCGCWGYHRSLFQTPIKNATTIPVEPHPPVNLQKIVVFHGKPYSPKKTTTVSCSDMFFFSCPPKKWILGPWVPGLRTVHEALLFQQEAKEGKHTAGTGTAGAERFWVSYGRPWFPKFSLLIQWLVGSKKGVYRMRLSERGHHRIQSLIRSWFSCEYGREFLGEFSGFGLYQRRVKSSFGLIQTFCMAIFIGNDDFLNHGILMYHTFTQTSVFECKKHHKNGQCF